VRLSVGSKTFLIGEYLALRGGPALVAVTQPRFSLDLSSQGEAFHHQSPAGRLIQESSAKASLRFFDPHTGAGGFGASTAQFVLSYVALKAEQMGFAAALAEIRADSGQGLLETYWRCSSESSAVRPSGFDVLAQIFGGLVSLDLRAKAKISSTHSWPMRGLSFTLIRTGAKLATHEHLKEVSMTTDWRDLETLAEVATAALAKEQSAEFCQVIDEYGLCLARRGWLAPRSAEIIEQIRQVNLQKALGVEAVKGCGALGADVILLLHKTEGAQRLHAWLKESGLESIATEADLSVGLERK